jgi:FxsC-like protein
VTGLAAALDAVGLRASYFFLSYAHSPPLAGTPQTAQDQWVRTFFRDLSGAVNRMRSREQEIDPGFLDQELPLGSNWHAANARALSAAAVFVPLYSPGYFARSWPGREWECFRRRMIDAGLENPMERFEPVLWIPLPPGQYHDGLDQALALGAADSEYAANGLLALLRLTPYRESYKRIVDRLARRIVELAEKSPIAPSPVPDIYEVQSPFSPSSSAAVFVVAMAVSRTGNPSAGDRQARGVRRVTWRPFPETQELSLAEYTATLAEQLDFAVVAADLDEAKDELAGNPGVLIIDPWYVADEAGLRELRRVAGELKPWNLPVLVVNPGADRREAELAQRVRVILDRSQLVHTEPAAQAIAGVTSLEQFVTLMPFLIAEAERQYLRRGPIIRSVAPPGSRPRLLGDELTAGPARDPQKEDPDD